MEKKLLILALAFIILPSLANADWAFGYWGKDFYMELYSGSKWQRVQQPYTYSYEGWYYFDYPYRVYHYGSYYYYEAGWYSYRPYWRYNPWDYYSYYPSTYYYYGGHWYYSPDWIYSYGPAYYGPYHYPPAGSGTGYSYTQKQEAYCNEISLRTSNVSITAGSTKEASFWINNNSRKDFTIKSAKLYIDSFDVSEAGLDYDDYIKAGRSGEIAIKLKAGEGAESDIIKAELRLSGQFTDATYCSYSDIGEEPFTIYLTGSEKAASQSSYPAQSNAWAYSSASYREHENVSSWQEVETAAAARETTKTPTAQESATATAAKASPGSGASMTSGTGAPHATAAQASAGSGAAYLETESQPQGNCNGLAIVAENISLEGGESTYREIYVRNYAAADFRIDSVNVKEYSPAFSAKGLRKDGIVYSGSMARVGIEVNAFRTETDSTGTPNLEVNGQFASGRSCTITEQLQVYVRANESAGIDDIKLVVPEHVYMGDYALLNISIDNPTKKEVSVRISGRKLEANPAVIIIPPATYAERVVSITGLQEGKSYVYYYAEAGGTKIVEKFTAVEAQQAGEGNGGTASGEGIRLISYLSKAEIGVDGNTQIDFLIENLSDSSSGVTVRVRGLPKGFQYTTAFLEIGAKSRGQATVTIAATAAAEGEYTATAEIIAGSQKIERPITLHVAGQLESKANAPGVGGEQSLAAIVSTAMLILAENASAVNIGLVLIVFILVYLLYRKIAK